MAYQCWSSCDVVFSVFIINDRQLVRNQKNSDNIHEPFAILENQSQCNETYRRIDCYLLVTETNICENCQKLKDTLIKIKNRN